MILFYGVRWCIIISYSLKRFVYVVPRMLFSGASVEVVALSRISPSPSSTDPPVVPPANQVSDVFCKRRPVGRCGGQSVELDTCELQRRKGRAMSIVVRNCVVIVG